MPSLQTFFGLSESGRMSQSAEKTPLMKQFDRLKTKAGSALLLFRMGDFYELFGNDAVLASQLLDITLTSRDKKAADPLPMAGVPAHSVSGYIQKLLDAGHEVAVAEQMQDPETVKGLVEREIVRTYTPGIRLEMSQTDPALLAYCVWDGSADLVLANVATGNLYTLENQTLDRIARECRVRPVRHLIVELSGEPFGGAAEDDPTVLRSLADFGILVQFVEKRSIANLSRLERATQGLFETVRSKLGVDLSVHFKAAEKLASETACRLHPTAIAHLDLTSPEPKQPSLFRTVNRTRSAAGARKLEAWVLAPLLDRAQIRERQEAVRGVHILQGLLKETLTQVYDLERLLVRLSSGLAEPKDTLALGKTLAIVPAVIHALANVTAGSLLEKIRITLAAAGKQVETLARTLVDYQIDPPPAHARDGEIFRRGYNAELDPWIDLTEHGTQQIAEMETRERTATGIASLKIRYHRVFGYTIEVTRTHAEKVPAHYHRKQSMANAERYTIEELAAFEEKLLSASTKRNALERELFDRIIGQCLEKRTAIVAIAENLAILDALLALAHLLDRPGWTFPIIDDSMDLVIEDGRHPVLDLQNHSGFVPTTLHLNAPERTHVLITGPNMGGKSTLMRQAAQIVVLGQIGAPVPARSARWGVVTGIHTRIGARDEILRGASTFMVEMEELGMILETARPTDLILLDEIGRGTSTFDGLSVAWATTEWLCKELGARTMFATHYHELTHLEGSLKGLKNIHMEVEKPATKHGKLRFLYTVAEGPANESFGIHVAERAGLPPAVTARAWEKLRDFEGTAPLQLGFSFGLRSEPQRTNAKLEAQAPPAEDRS